MDGLGTYFAFFMIGMLFTGISIIFVIDDFWSGKDVSTKRFSCVILASCIVFTLYCGVEIKSKIETQLSYIKHEAQFSNCPNCEKSLKDMKNIDSCPYCGFELVHMKEKITECKYCHRSLEDMEHLGDKCPYCGNKIN